MSNITINRAGELLRCVFEVLWDKPDGLPAREVLSRIPQIISLTNDELSLSTVTRTPRFEKIVRISSFPVTQAGWLAKNEKGLWRITAEGYEACNRFSSAQAFYLAALNLFNERRRAAPEIMTALELAQESAWVQINKHLFTLGVNELQAMVSDLLRAMGYYPAWTAPPEKQHGRINLIAYTDPMGVKGQRILVQIIQKGQPVTVEGIRSFFSMVGNADYGMILSMGGFTSEAQRDLSLNHFQKVTALDAPAFFDLWESYYSDLKEEVRRYLPLRAVNFLVSND